MLKAAASPEAAMDTAKEAGFAITSEDIQSMQSESESVESSDKELDAGGAAGGFSSTRGAGNCCWSGTRR